MALLEVRGLEVAFPKGPHDEALALRGVDLDLDPGERLGVVGESGAGKSMLAFAILNLISEPGRISAGSIRFDGRNLLTLPPKEIRNIRGNRISMIFQDPMMTLNPVLTIGRQMVETLQAHRRIGWAKARKLSIERLAQVAIPTPESRFDSYPHELSGGLRQRVVIAIALLTDPEIIIADEPTTALDVTTQAQIMQLMAELQQELGMAMMLITHNLGVVAQMAEEVIVMYLGKVMERADVHTLFSDPKHPYTQELLKSIPRLSRTRQTERLAAISGNVPPPFVRPSGCPFHPRCPKFMPGVCDVIEPQLMTVGANHTVSCLLYSDVSGAAPGKPS